MLVNHQWIGKLFVWDIYHAFVFIILTNYTFFAWHICVHEHLHEHHDVHDTWYSLEFCKHEHPYPTFSSDKWLQISHSIYLIYLKLLSLLIESSTFFVPPCSSLVTGPFPTPTQLPGITPTEKLSEKFSKLSEKLRLRSSRDFYNTINNLY